MEMNYCIVRKRKKLKKLENLRNLTRRTRVKQIFKTLLTFLLIISWTLTGLPQIPFTNFPPKIKEVRAQTNTYTAESLTTSSTTLTTLQNKVTLNFTPASTAEHWVVVATGEVRRNNTTVDVNGDGVILGRFAMSLDGTVIPVTPYAGYAGSGAGVTGGNHTAWKTFQVFRKITGFNTQRTAIIQWRSESGAATEIRNARILAFRIPNEASANIQYVEALSVVNDLVNPTSALTLTWTPSSLGDYILMGQGFHHEGPGGAATGGLFWVDEGTEATNTDDSYIGQNEPGVPFFHVQRKNLTVASHTFILRHKPDITTGSERFGLAILAFRADVFDNTETSEALANSATTSTTYQDKINFTVATAASARDHVFLLTHTPHHVTSSTNQGRYGRILLNGVEMTEEAPAQVRGTYRKGQGLAWALNTVGGITVQAQFRSPDGVASARDEQARLVVLRYPAAGVANATQIHYRWRNDNGDEIDTGDGADGLLAPTGTFNLNTDESGGRTFPDGIAYRVAAPADAASSVSQYSASDDFQGIAAGDEVLLINMQGTSTDNADVGNYEFMEVQSVTSTTLTFTASITKSYDGTTASNQKVVVQRVPNYTGVTLDSTDSLTASDWDGLGSCLGGSGQSCRLTGIVVLRATGTVNVGTGTSVTVAGKGFRLGSGVASGNNIRGSQGESYTGVGAAATSTANGGGGGGGELTNVGGDACGSGGAGGGYGASGSSGGYGSSCGGTLPANGPGATYGSADLSKIFLGSGGGGGGKDEHSVTNCPSNPASGDGADGGGTVVVLANTITVSGGVSANGNNGSTAPCLSDNGNGGGGSGGSVYLAAVNVTLNTNLVTATAGSGAASGGTWNGAGGNGGAGRIRVETGSVTSVTTNPSASLSANAPAGATFAVAQDTLLSGLAKSTTKRIRIEISNEGDASSGAISYRVEVSQPNPAACSSATYTRVDTDTHWDVVASTNITDGDPTANVHVAGTQALTDENTTFVAGRLEESVDQLLATITLATTEFTEIEYAVQATTSATDGATYCFRLTNAGATTNFTYTQYAQVTLAGPATVLTQNDFEFWVDNDLLTPVAIWGNPDIPENTALNALPPSNDPIDPADEIRIRMNISVTVATLAVSTEDFILQYKEAQDCTDAAAWTDVDAAAGAGTWRFAASTVADNTTLTTLLVATSDVAGRYNKSDPTSTNPNAVLAGQEFEWDWHVEYNGTAAAKTYCFRMVKSPVAALDAYNADSYPRVDTRPGTADLMRHGNFFTTGIERGFFWAD